MPATQLALEHALPPEVLGTTTMMHDSAYEHPDENVRYAALTSRWQPLTSPLLDLDQQASVSCPM